MFYFFILKTLARTCLVNGSVDSMKLLVDKGCSTDTLLSTAIMQLNREAFDFLLSKNIDLNETTAKMKTPINFAVIMKNRYFLTRLLDAGADASLIDSVIF